MTIEFIVSNNHNDDDLNFPLTVLYGYLGCSKSQLINEYSKIWTDRGFNVLIYFPSSIFSNYRNGVRQINQWIIKYFNENPYSCRILIFHSISSGANFLSYHLKYLSMGSDYYNSSNNNNNNNCGYFILPMIKACIFDNITNFNNSFLNFKNNLLTSGNLFKYIHSLFLPLFIPLWTLNEKKDFKFLISKNNKFHYLVIYNNDDFDSKYFIKTLKQKGNQFNEKNSNSNIILIEKIINENNINNTNIYTESINQLIDLIIYNYKIINNYNNSNNNKNNNNIRHQNSKNTLYW